MGNDQPLELKLGRIRNKHASGNERLFKLVVREASKSVRKKRWHASPLTRRPVAELARGKGSFPRCAAAATRVAPGDRQGAYRPARHVRPWRCSCSPELYTTRWRYARRSAGAALRQGSW